MKIIYISTDSYGFESEGDLTAIAVSTHSDRWVVGVSRGRLGMLRVSTWRSTHDLRANILHGVISSVLWDLNLMLSTPS